MQVLNSSFNKQFTRASEVQIPDVYFRRFKTGKQDLDEMFGGEGFLPGMTFTLAAAPGTGKTSFLIQILELLENSGKKTAYISGEEGIEQLAFTSKRLNVHKVPLANMTDIDEICNCLKENKFDFVVLDSMPSLTGPKELNSRETEEYIVSKILQTAKELETVIGVILHFTKTGTYKGSTLLPHSVDCNIIMDRNKEELNLREIEITKNRFGSCGFTVFEMFHNGFNFESKELSEEQNNSKQISKKEVVFNTLGQNEKNIQELVLQTGISVTYLNTILRELQLEGKITKEGRGIQATFKPTNNP